MFSHKTLRLLYIFRMPIHICSLTKIKTTNKCDISETFYIYLNSPFLLHPFFVSRPSDRFCCSGTDSFTIIVVASCCRPIAIIINIINWLQLSFLLPLCFDFPTAMNLTWGWFRDLIWFTGIQINAIYILFMQSSHPNFKTKVKNTLSIFIIREGII